MMINRRNMLAGSAALATTALVAPRIALADQTFAPAPGQWRQFTVTTQLNLPADGRKAQAWIPLPSVQEDGWIKGATNQWTTNAATAKVERDKKHGAQMLHVVFKDGEKAPSVEVTSAFAVQDRAADLGKKASPASLSASERALYLEATELMPTDGIVKETASKIIAGKTSDVEKARAIYEWVVDNTFRNAATRGCGTGDVASMLRTGNLSGKCADLNALFVALVRASGVPARDVYGIRVGPSKFGYKSLGTGSDNITKAQHCRSEVWLEGIGWIATDPADVRKVVLEEPPGNQPLNAPKVVAAREKLFGAWEGNWLAYNTAHDLELPGSAHKVAFLMYPQAEIAGALLDCLDADGFRYAIRSTELKA